MRLIWSICKFFLIAIGLVVTGAAVSVLSMAPEKRVLNTSSPDPHEAALALVSLNRLQWASGGFGSVMTIRSAEIANRSGRDLKDPRIECETFGASGTRLSSLSHTVYQSLPAGKTIRISDVNMGFMNSQSRSASCSIAGAVFN